MLSPALLAIVLAVQISPSTSDPFQQVQLAAEGPRVFATFVNKNKILFAVSGDQGKTWPAARVIAEPGVISAGRHRGPRIVVSGQNIVISVVAGESGGGKDGDLLALRSTDAGKSWQPAVRINDVSGSAREGLHAMTASGAGLIYAAWLDLRKPGTRLYGSLSTDGGATWSRNEEIYHSPDGTICQCCHPSVAISKKGVITVMWRNALGGNRDFYISSSTDRGTTFSAAQKLGVDSWKLDACPMDGGGLAFDSADQIESVWRRKTTVFTARAGQSEQAVATGKDPVLAVAKAGAYLAWRSEKGLEVRKPGDSEANVLDADGEYAALLALPDGSVAVGWERHGAIYFERLR